MVPSYLFTYFFTLLYIFIYFLIITLILNSLRVKNCCQLCCEKNKDHGRKLEAFRLLKIFSHQPACMLCIIYII